MSTEARLKKLFNEMIEDHEKTVKILNDLIVSPENKELRSKAINHSCDVSTMLGEIKTAINIFLPDK